MRLVSYADLKPRFGVNYSRQHISRLIRAGKWPKPRPITPGGLHKYWVEEELLAHLKASRAASEDAATERAA